MPDCRMQNSTNMITIHKNLSTYMAARAVYGAVERRYVC